MNRDLTAFPRLAYTDAGTAMGMQYLRQDSLLMVNRLIDWYDYYDGKHWTDKDRDELTPEKLRAIYGLDYDPTMLTVNLVAWFVEKLASFMFERPVGISCPVEQIDDSTAMASPDYQPSAGQQAASEVAASREWLLQKLRKQNLLDEKLYKAALDYLIGGSVAVKLHYDKGRGLRFIWRPRLEFWPLFNPDDIDVLEKLPFVAFVDDETIWKQTYWMKNGSCWMEEGLYGLDLKLKKELVAPYDMGLPFMPIEIFQRGGLTGEPEGRSLVQTLLPLNEEIEKKLSDSGDSLKFGMFAVKVILNADTPREADIKAGRAQRLQVAPNSLWTLNGDGAIPADVKTLEQKYEYREALKQHLDDLLSLMHRLANVPDISLEKVTGLGNMSGFALRILYGPIISETNKAMTTWRPRLQRLFGKALYMLNKYDTSRHYDQEWIRDADLGSIDLSELDDLVEIATTMPIPENETEVVDRETKKVALLLQSIKGAMDELGIENPEQKLAEILAEKKILQEVLGGLMDEPEAGGDSSADGESGEAE